MGASPYCAAEGLADELGAARARQDPELERGSAAGERLGREVGARGVAGELVPAALARAVGQFRGGDDPEAEVMKKNFLVAVDQALQKLPPDLKVMVILADVEGFTYQEMATILQCPLGTIMSRLHRARRCLEQEMQAFTDGTFQGRAQI